MEKISTHSEQYCFEDFTHDAYRSLLQLTKDAGYEFISFRDCENKGGPWVLWRHDLDFSPHRALKLARIEHEMGVKSTFFLLPHSRFYNLFEKENFDIIREFENLGHDIALHFDFAFYDVTDQRTFEENLISEKNFLERTFHRKIEAFSFHNPNKWALNYGQHNVAGMINAYSTFFVNNVAYASDSNGYWRNESIAQRLEESHHRVQILTHPVWWTEKLTSPKERVWSAIEGRSSSNKKKQLEHWEKWGRELPDWNG
ncbi:MAG TPA: hypothetical protein DCX14_16100 [Flavobacteriales bacterium]|mgnify:FL=1|jgi:hypothetical protein|nr:hypothetical protein [Flavobacteriales bacterium]HAW21704.1 hypothetical protein [Flavobacteriales bacterium]